MGEEGRAARASGGGGETSAGAGADALGTPDFDARSIRRARPAVPLTRADGRPSLLTWAVVALVAGMVGGLLGIFVINAFQRGDASEPAATRTAGANANDAATNDTRAGGAAGAATPADAQADTGPTPGGAAPDANQSAAADAPGADGAAGADGAGGAEGAGAAAGGDEAAQLRGALAEWIAATNARDIDRQMEFYDARLGVFYLARDTSRAAVRAEKANAFARASSVEVRADEPQITVAPDGRTAVMRFRKQYAIGAGGDARRGAVLQELRWRRTPAGWRIVGERDLREMR